MDTSLVGRVRLLAISSCDKGYILCLGGIMETKPLVPAAQYVRMSTEDQQYSIANQKAAINAYARCHG